MPTCPNAAARVGPVPRPALVVSRHLGWISKAALVVSQHVGWISKAALVVSQHLGWISKAAFVRRVDGGHSPRWWCVPRTA
jgi:hypothetical protein